MRFSNTYLKRNAAFFLVLSLFAILHLFIVVFNHFTYKTFAYDYAVYNFAFFDFAHFKISPCPVYLSPHPVTFLQDHFSLTLMLFLPLYWILVPLFGTYTLLIIQWMIVVTGGIAVYKLICIKGQNKVISLAAMIYYFLLYGRYASYQSDCNLVIIGSAVIPVFLYYFEKENLPGTLLAFVFLIISREDFSFDLSFLCLMLVFLNRHNKFKLRLSLILLVISISSFIIIFKFIIPSLEDYYRKYTLFNYSALGKNPAEAFRFFISHPLKILEMLFSNHTANPGNDGLKMEFYLIYLISGGFLLFLRPVYILPLIPLVFKKVLNDDPLRWGIEMYHSVEIASILPILVFSVLLKLRSAFSREIGAYIVCALTLGVTLFCFNIYIQRSYSVNKVNFLTGSFYSGYGDIGEINKITRLIPDTAAVCASGRLTTHLSLRKHIFHFPSIDESHYVVIQRDGGTWPIDQKEFNQRIKGMAVSNEWVIRYASEKYILFERE